MQPHYAVKAIIFWKDAIKFHHLRKQILKGISKFLYCFLRSANFGQQVLQNVVNGGEYAVRKMSFGIRKSHYQARLFLWRRCWNDPIHHHRPVSIHEKPRLDNVYYFLNTNSNQSCNNRSRTNLRKISKRPKPPDIECGRDQSQCSFGHRQVMGSMALMVMMSTKLLKRYNLKNFQNKYKDEMDGDGNIIFSECH